MTVVASNFTRRVNDLYETEEWATEALLKFLPLSRVSTVWEPAAGNHKIADVLRRNGLDVITSDVAVYDREHDFAFDFLDERAPSAAVCDAIVTNPPYGPGNRLAAKFARLALERCDGWVALLLTAKFDFAKTRMDLFRDNPRFGGKVQLVDRIQWFEGECTGTEDHSWYIWAPTGKAIFPPSISYAGREY